jgi:hypothetical protein
LIIQIQKYGRRKQNRKRSCSDARRQDHLASLKIALIFAEDPADSNRGDITDRQVCNEPPGPLSAPLPSLQTDPY